MKKILLLFIIFCLFTPSFLFAQNLYQYKLKNGLQLIVKVDKRAPVAVFQIWYRVGSSYEPYGLTGISHLTEHMMFDGTSTYPEGVLTKTLTVNGASFNAFTDRDYTAYYEELSVNRLPLAFKMEADRMINLSITQQQFDKEINVVKEERRLRTDDQPMQIALERFLAAAYVSTSYHHPVVGWMDDLNHMSALKVRRWYNDWYAPNNATIVIVGDVVPTQMLALTKQFFGNLNKRSLPSTPATAEIPSLGKRTVIVKIPAKIPLLLMGYNAPSLMTATDQWQAYALSVLTGILAGDPSSRFARDLVRGTAIASSADADYDPFARLDTLVILSGVPAKKDDIKNLQNAFDQQIKSLQTDVVSADELARVKTQEIAQKVYSRDSIVGQATEIGATVSVGLPLNTIDTYIQGINAVTAEQVRQVAQLYLTKDNLTETILEPLPLTVEQEQQQAAVQLTGSVH